VAGKDRIFWKFVAQIFTHISLIKTVVYKMEEAIVYWFVVRKIVCRFFDIRFHFPGICISKTCFKQGNSEIRKLGLRDEFDSPNI
jgi:hypothetical protein